MWIIQMRGCLSNSLWQCVMHLDFQWILETERRIATFTMNVAEVQSRQISY